MGCRVTCCLTFRSSLRVTQKAESPDDTRRNDFRGYALDLKSPHMVEKAEGDRYEGLALNDDMMAESGSLQPKNKA